MITIGWMPYKKGEADEWEADITIELASGRKDRKRYKCKEHRWIGHPDRDRVQDKNRPRGADRWASRKAEKMLTRLQSREPAQRAPLFCDYWPHFIEWCRNEKETGTVNLRVSHGKAWLLEAFTGLRLDQIDDEVVKALWNRIGRQAARPNVVATISKCLHRAIADKQLAAMPCTFGRDTGVFLGTKRPKQRDAYYRDFDGMVAAAQHIGPEALAAVLLGSDAGMRVGEIIGLEWFHVGKETITIKQQIYRGVKKHVKGGKDGDKNREVWLTDRLKLALAGLPKRTHTGTRLPGSYVLSSKSGAPYAYKKMQTLLARVEAGASVTPTGKNPRRARTHVARHTFCTRLAERGARIHEIQDLAGHADINVTRGYMHHAPDGLKTAIHRLNDVGENVEKGGTKTPKR